MLEAIGVSSVEELFEDIPPSIRNPRLDLPPPLSELEATAGADLELEALKRKMGLLPAEAPPVSARVAASAGAACHAEGGPLLPAAAACA